MAADKLNDLENCMLFLTDKQFHETIASTQIRNPDLVVGAYLCLVFDQSKGLKRPLSLADAARMVLEGHKAVGVYWREHPGQAQTCRWKPTPPNTKHGEEFAKVLKTFSGKLSRISCG